MKELIERVLTENKITQQELCDRIGVSPATIKRLKGTLPYGNVSESLTEKIKTQLLNMIAVPNEMLDKYNTANDKKIFKLQEKNRLLNKQNTALKKERMYTDDVLEAILEKISIREPIPVNLNIFDSKPVIGRNSLIIQLSDLHLGSIVDLKGNKFDMEIARQRLNEYCAIAIDMVYNNNVDEIIILNTGDVFSLDYRADQSLCLVNTRAENFVDGFDIMAEFMESIVSLGIRTRVIGVLSNESRLKGYENPSVLDKEAIDSFDYMLHAMLKRTFSKQSHVIFENECSTLEYMFEVKNQNIYALHGHTVKGHDENYFSSIKLNNITEYGYVADMVILGHIHKTSINPYWCRSASLKGSNEYSNRKLTLQYTPASQNLFLVNEERIIPMPITLK